MNKKIKIIELLNRIANREEVPKKIRFSNETLEYDVDCQDYKGFSRTGSGAFLGYLFTNEPTQNFINERVEILEDNTEELGKLNELYEKYMNQKKEIEELKVEILELSSQRTDGFLENDRLRNEMEKQQKEIEELKENQIWSEATIEGLKTDFIHKDKIREKIKELEKYMDNAVERSTIDEYKFAIEMFLELLEE